MRRFLRFLGDLPWPIVLIASLLVLAVTVYYAISFERREANKEVNHQISDLTARLGRVVADIDGTRLVIGGDAGGGIRLSTGPAAKGSDKPDEADARAVQHAESSIQRLQSQGLSVKPLPPEENGNAAPNEPGKAVDQQQARRAFERAVQFELNDVLQAVAAGYRMRTNILMIGLVAILLSTIMIAKALISRQRAAEAALANTEAERAQLAKEMTEAKLAMMQAQIEPHFLFNTMGSVQHLIETDPTKAALLQQNLIQYLRSAMPQIRDSSTTLGREIELARAYLNILKTRMEDRLTFFVQVPEWLLNAPMPSMMLMTLLENAIKHGIEPKPGGGTIQIDAEQRGDTLCVSVSDTGLGCAPKPGTGIGLANIRERLKLLYADRARLILEPADPGTKAVLEIPLAPA